MKLLTKSSKEVTPASRVLFKKTLDPGRVFARLKPRPKDQAPQRGKYPWAFAGIYLIMLLIFIRPQEVWPSIFGVLPWLKIVGASTILIYVLSKYAAGEKLIVWSLEFKAMVLMAAMGLLLTPIASSPGDSIGVLLDTFITLLIIFSLMTNLIDTRDRLRWFLFAMVVSEFLYASSAMKTYLTQRDSDPNRITGWGTQLENPNDLACVLDLMLPLTVYFFLTRKGWLKVFAFISILITVFSVFFTLSRSGFLGLMAAAATMIWKMSSGYRIRIGVATLALGLIVFVALPGQFRNRLSTIMNPETDQTHSAQERQMLMQIAADLAVKRSVIGVGMGNFHIYSYKEKVAHNSFLETSAELGVIGLLAYLVLIFAPIKSLRRIERQSRKDGARPDREVFIMSVCFQASLAAYMIYGFFGSVQYFPYMYFSVAYAVALRRIFAAEAPTESESPGNMALTLFSKPAGKGALWKPSRLRNAN